jgi:hypothetical protein
MEYYIATHVIQFLAQRKANFVETLFLEFKGRGNKDGFLIEYINLLSRNKLHIME